MRFTKITLVIAFLGMLSAQSSFGQGQVVEKIVCKVDHEIILQSELETAYIQFQESGQFADSDLKCKVLETLIINKLLLAKAAIDSVTVDEDQLQQQLDGRMQQMLSMFGGDEKVIKEQYGKTVPELQEELRDQLREQLLTQKMQGKITAHVKVTPSEVKKFFNEIPRDSLPFFSTELEIGQIVRIPEAGKAQRKAVIDTLNSIKQRILDGADFGEMAKKYSEDPGSRVQGGELGFFKRRELVPEFEEAALQLQPGEMSQIVESQFGFHLIQLIEIRGGEYNSKHILMTAKNSNLDDELAVELLDSLRSVILNDSISFEKAANDYSQDQATKMKGGFFTDETGSTRVAADNTQIIGPDLYFMVKSMQPGDIAEPSKYRMADGKEVYRIVFLKSKTPPHVANLKDDYQKIYNAALQEAKNKAVNDWFKKTKNEVFLDIDKAYQGCEILVTQ